MPQRFLRPGIRTSEAWNKTSFLAQSLYVGILTLVDDFGRYDGRWRLLHAEIFGLRGDVKPQRSAAAFKELCDNDLIQYYLNDGKEYLQILRWSERTRSEKSRYPDPPQRIAADRSENLPSESKPSPSPLVISHKPSRVGAKRSHPAHLSPSELVEKYKTNPAYSTIDVQHVYNKMVNHCTLRFKQPTERRFVDWLNREDKPLAFNKDGMLPPTQLTKYGLPLPPRCSIRKDGEVLDYTGRVMDINQVRAALK